MAYWWVSQNKTWREEREGGFLWAPTHDRSGKTPHHWATMKEVAAGDIIFSFVRRHIVAVAVAQAAARPEHQPQSFQTGDAWSREGRRVDVTYMDIPRPLPIDSVLSTLMPLLAVPGGPLTRDGGGNQGYLFGISHTAAQLIFAALEQHAGVTVEQISDHVITRQTGITETTKRAMIDARVGQGHFREELMRLWSGRCSVTNVDASYLLRASHIMPWRDANNAQRLDPYNGLLLVPGYDVAFDGRFITFANDGKIIIDPALSPQYLPHLGIDPNARLRKVHPQHIPYLQYHRDQMRPASS